MKHALPLLSALPLTLFAVLHGAELDLSEPVRIETGLIEGVATPGNDVVVFKGIPYAAPRLRDWPHVSVGSNRAASVLQIVRSSIQKIESRFGNADRDIRCTASRYP